MWEGDGGKRKREMHNLGIDDRGSLPWTTDRKP